MGMLSVLKREVRHTGGVALYLFMCFSIFATLNKLFLALHQIAASAFVPAVLFTLALAKVVVLLDLTSLTTHLDARHPILVATLYKTLIYCVFSAPYFSQKEPGIFTRKPGPSAKPSYRHGNRWIETGCWLNSLSSASCTAATTSIMESTGGSEKVSSGA